MSLLKDKNRDLTYLYQSLEDKLNFLKPLNNGGFHDSIWRFELENGKVTLDFDFSLYDASHVNFMTEIEVKYGNNTVTLTNQDFAKAIWLDAVCDLQPRSQGYRGSYELLALLFAFLSYKEIDRLTPDSFTEFFAFCLTKDVLKTGLRRRLSTPSFGARIGALSLNKIQKIISLYGLTIFLSDATISRINESLNEACLSIADMTANTYKKGGSLNYLGLDVGKHYIDHCYNCFERFYAYASAINKVINTCDSSHQTLKKLGISNKSIKSAIGVILRGNERHDMYRESRLVKENFNAIEKAVQDVFRVNFVKAECFMLLFDIDVINNIIRQCDLPNRYDTQEFVRSLLFTEHFGEYGKSKSTIWFEYIAVLKDKDINVALSADEFEEISKEELDAHRTKLPLAGINFRAFLKKQFKLLPKSTQNQHFTGLRLFELFARKVRSAGFTCLIGSLGWRASEYMFSVSDIDIEKNIETSDNYYTPFRFHVISKVPKTNGETKLDREITMETYVIIRQIVNLIGDGDNENNFLIESTSSVKTAVRHWWADFVENYVLFTQIGNGTIPKVYGKELSLLRAKLKNELPMIKLSFSDKPSFGSYLRLYRENNLKDEKIRQLIEKNLSHETLTKVKSAEYQLTDAAVMFVRSEMLGDATYPTPHAFRHVWAEAVLRRYRGDVGKFIQSNFKHINRRFFMAYLRDKKIRILYESAKRHFVNSVVREHIVNLDDYNNVYAGGMGRFVRKAVGLTKVFSQEEYNNLAEKISDERIASVQPLPWATCMMRVGSEFSAKCSQNKIPQRHNAEPRLCLGCTNADVSKGNFLGIIVYTKSAIDSCRNPKLPLMFKASSIETVKVALKCINELKKNHNSNEYNQYLSLLEDTLKIVKEQERSEQ